MLVSRNQTAFSFIFGREEILKKKSGLATRDYKYVTELTQVYREFTEFD